MSVQPGTRLGPYDILARLGAGGMGEVYRATDTRLKRQVAIKILPAALAADPDRLARFQREAEVLASLNHPHIAAVYGLEEVDSTASAQPGKALVMELVDGPTLADRLAHGPLPVDEALAIARQIAAAVEAAHEQGIVHRDLKPANIKVRDDGTVKVLDFGLAKLAGAGVAKTTQFDISNSPTITGAAMTGMGVILGTAAYMSPEQARGRAVDKRTDLWAFGAVLYEMLTGARAFDGDDVTEMTASVMKSTPNWALLPGDTPPSVVTLIQRCLEKDRSARIGDIAVARFLLSEHASVGTTPTAPARSPVAAASPWRQRLSWSLRTAAVGTFAAVLAGAAVAWFSSAQAPRAVGVTRLQMAVFPSEHLVGSLAAKPQPGESRDLWVYDSVRGAPTRLTFDGADAPIWSPDGKRLLYVRGNLHTISADGSGKPEPLDTGDGSFPTSWAPGVDAVVYVRKTQSGNYGIWVLPMNGPAKPRLFLESRFDLWHPDLSPDGRWMAYTSFESGTPEVYVQAHPGPGEKVRISTAGGFDPLWTAGGRELLYRSGTLEKQSFLSVAVRSASPFHFDAPRLLFEAKVGEYDTTAPERSWHVSPDGKRFLLLRSVPLNDKPVTSMHIVLNWTEELRRLVRAK